MAGTRAVFELAAVVSGLAGIRELNKSIKEASSNGDKIKRSFAAGAVALKAFAASASVAAFTGLIKSQINLGDQLYDLSQRTGVAVETLSKYKVAADLSGSSIEDVASAIDKLNKNLIKSKDPASDAAKAFNALFGKDYKTEGKSVEQVIGDIADAFSKSEDGADKATIAIALFGKAGAQLIPFLNQGREEIEKFNSAVSADFSAASDRFNDELTMMSTNVGTFGRSIATVLLPALTDLLHSLNNISGVLERLKGLNQNSFIENIYRRAGASSAVMDPMASSNLWDPQRMEGILATAKKIDALNTPKARLDASKLSGKSEPKAKKDTQAEDFQKLLEKLNRERVKSEMDAADAAREYIAVQEQELETLKQQAEYIGKTSIEIEKLKDARKIDTDAAEKMANMALESRDAFKQETEAIKAQRQEVLELNYALERTMTSGAKSFLAQYVEEATNSAAQIKTVLENAFNGATDALVDFATTGKLRFKDFAGSIIRDMLRINIQRNILGPLAGLLGGVLGGGAGASYSMASVRGVFNPSLYGPGFAMGGVMSSDGPRPLRKYARGGIADSPQMAIFGEGSRPEAYVPLPDGHSIPVALQGGGGSTNVSVVVNMDGGTDDTKSNSKAGGDIGRLIAGTVKATLVNEMRPGGILAGRA